jgi:hypothetical protein
MPGFLQTGDNKQKSSRSAAFVVFANSDDGGYARFLNSLVRVSISILSPISQNAATANS